MKIKIKGGTYCSPDELRNLQREIGRELSESFKAFVKGNDGAESESNIFKIADGIESGVNRFIPVRDILNEARRIENLPKHSYPVAWAEGGNYVLVDEGENGQVYFWDHEKPAKLIRIAGDFASFLELLEPFDVSSIQLKPGQVKRAWIDPDFLKNQKKST